MKIIIETLATDVDTTNRLQRCSRCPQEFYFQCTAQPEQIGADIEAHLQICPGRQAQAQAA